MDNEIMVSVICTVYNHEKYLRKCLDGFVTQKTNFKFEVLIHDDASTDSSADIIREYEKKYPDIIKPIYQTENQYSKGIKIGPTFLYPKAKGKYIAFCEGDDYWCDENKLQKQFDVMEENPDCSICVHKVADVYENGMPMGSFRPSGKINNYIINTEEYIRILLKYDHPFQTSSLFLRMSLFDYKNMPKFWKESPVGDVPMVLYFVSKGNLYYIDETMSCYRNNSVGSWTSRMSKSSKAIKSFSEKIVELFRQYDEYTEFKYTGIINTKIDKMNFNIARAHGYPKIALQRKYRSYFQELSIKEKIYIVFSAYLPHIMKLYRKIKDKNNV